MSNAILLLEDGSVHYGKAFGKRGTTSGEICFNTGMTGYQEVFTDPSYYGQVLIMNSVHIGNYGVKDGDIESDLVPVFEAVGYRLLRRINPHWYIVNRGHVDTGAERWFRVPEHAQGDAVDLRNLSMAWKGDIDGMRNLRGEAMVSERGDQADDRAPMACAGKVEHSAEPSPPKFVRIFGQRAGHAPGH